MQLNLTLVLSIILMLAFCQGGSITHSYTLTNGHTAVFVLGGEPADSANSARFEANFTYSSLGEDGWVGIACAQTASDYAISGSSDAFLVSAHCVDEDGCDYNLLTANSFDSAVYSGSISESSGDYTFTMGSMVSTSNETVTQFTNDGPYGYQLSFDLDGALADVNMPDDFQGTYLQCIRKLDFASGATIATTAANYEAATIYEGASSCSSSTGEESHAQGAAMGILAVAMLALYA